MPLFCSYFRKSRYNLPPLRTSPKARMENREVANILRDTAQLLEIDGAIIGRYRSYEKVADLIVSLPERIEDIAKDSQETHAHFPASAKTWPSTSTKYSRLAITSSRQKLLKKYPATLLELLDLQSLGPKKVALLWKNFQVGTVADIEKLAREDKLRDLDGFGEKSEQNILKAIGTAKRRVRPLPHQRRRSEAESLAEFILDVGESVEVRHRRRLAPPPPRNDRRPRSSRHDASGQGQAQDIRRRSRAHPEISAASSKRSLTAKTKSASCSRVDLQVDVRLLDKNSFGAALLYFTGSKDHNVALRGRANEGLDAERIRPDDDQRRQSTRQQNRRRHLLEAQAPIHRARTPRNARRNRSRRSRQAPALVELKDMRGDCTCTPPPPTDATPSKKWAPPHLTSATNTSPSPTTRKPSRSQMAWTKNAPSNKSPKFAPRKNESPASACSPESKWISSKNGKLRSRRRSPCPARRRRRLDSLLHEYGTRGDDRAHPRRHRKSLHPHHRPSHGTPCPPPRSLISTTWKKSSTPQKEFRRHGMQRGTRIASTSTTSISGWRSNAAYKLRSQPMLIRPRISIS